VPPATGTDKRTAARMRSRVMRVVVARWYWIS
jgi:hypothetical protein